MPRVERLINGKLYRNYELIETPDDVDLTLHMGPFENGRRDVNDSNDEDEWFPRFSFANI